MEHIKLMRKINIQDETNTIPAHSALTDSSPVEVRSKLVANVGTSTIKDRQLGLISSSRLNRKQPTKQKSERLIDIRECPSTSKSDEYEVPADPDEVIDTVGNESGQELCTEVIDVNKETGASIPVKKTWAQVAGRNQSEHNRIKRLQFAKQYVNKVSTVKHIYNNFPI
ncbi:hypothetical protein C0J52_04401 [Blattella germanica]|nr:hypothetical protein C0J52_04401 [Blattella germanica]